MFDKILQATILVLALGVTPPLIISFWKAMVFDQFQNVGGAQ